MSLKWWSVIIGSFVLWTTLIVVGFWQSEERRNFLESILAEWIGLLFALGIVVWLIEGPVLTRERKLRRILEYKWKVFQKAWEIGHMLAREMAESLVDAFEPKVDLYGEERGNWQRFEPLLRKVFKHARDVPDMGLPSHPSLEKGDVDKFFELCRSMIMSIREVIDSDHEMEGNVSLLASHLHQIEGHIERAERLGLVQNQGMRYELMGEIGGLTLDVIEAITRLPEGSKPT